MTPNKLASEHKLLKSLFIPADATSEQARAIITGAIALRTVNENRLRLRQARRDYGTCKLEQAVEIAEALGYDKSRGSGQKAIAYLMRMDIGGVRQLMEPDVSPNDEDGDTGGIDVDQIIADAMKP